jgi:hypothetical protein
MLLSLRWSVGVLKDSNNNGITGWPRLYPPNLDVPDNPDRCLPATQSIVACSLAARN